MDDKISLMIESDEYKQTIKKALETTNKIKEMSSLDALILNGFELVPLENLLGRMLLACYKE